jgi:hypothetical protein
MNIRYVMTDSCMIISLKEQIQNRLLMLYLIHEHNNQSKEYLRITRIQKLSFLSELEMLSDKVKGLNFLFFRYTHGPMSKEVYQELEHLRFNGLIERGSLIALTRNGEAILDKCKYWFKDNRDVTDYISFVTKEFKGYDLPKLLDYVYNIEIDVRNLGVLKIRDIPKGYDLLCPLKSDEAKIEFRLDGGDVETLDILLDSKAFSSLNDAVKDAGEKPSHIFMPC